MIPVMRYTGTAFSMPWTIISTWARSVIVTTGHNLFLLLFITRFLPDFYFYTIIFINLSQRKSPQTQLFRLKITAAYYPQNSFLTAKTQLLCSKIIINTLSEINTICYN